MVYITNALAFLCECARVQTIAAGVDPGPTPDPIGIGWVVATAEQLTQDPDDDEADEDDDFDHIPGLTIETV